MLYQTKNPHGGDIYGDAVRLDFSANINPLGTPEGVLAAAHRALEDICHYPDPSCRALTAAIAGYEGVPQEYILCGNGAAELIYSYCAALRPRCALELAPTFLEYGLALAQVGCRVERCVLRQENDFMPDGTLLDTVGREKPEAVFLCSPNNPTGQLLPPALLEALLALCAKQGTRVFLDECFLDLSEGGVSARSLLSHHRELTILKAFTKSYGMAGLRLGYCLSADTALLAAMAKTVPPWNVSLPAQAAGVAALGEETFLQQSRQLIASERQWLTRELTALGLWVCPSGANFLLFRAAPELGTALRQRGIALRDCANYHGLGSGWYRTAVRLHEENEQLIAAIGNAVGKERLWQEAL